MPSPREIGVASRSTRDQQFESLLRAARNFHERMSAIGPVTLEEKNPMEDLFERARKAFFGNKKP